MAFKFIQTEKIDVLNIKYEDLVAEPVYYIQKMRDYCNLSQNEKQLSILSKQIKTNRSYTFRRDETLKSFYDRNKKNYWMQRLGYGA